MSDGVDHRNATPFAASLAAAGRVLSELPPATGLLPLVLALGLWELIALGQSPVSPYFPPPSAWWGGIVELARSGRLLPAFGATVATLLSGLATAIACGGTLGLLIGISPRTRRALGPLLEFLRAIPPPAVVPLAILFLGYDARMKLAVVALAALWPILLNTVSAAQRINPLLLDVARSFRLSWLDRMRRVIAPAIVPALLLGIRVSLPLAIVVTLLVEILTSIDGMGALMIRAQRNFKSGEVYGLLVLVGLFGYLVNDVFAVIEAMVLRRFPPKQGA